MLAAPDDDVASLAPLIDAAVGCTNPLAYRGLTHTDSCADSSGLVDRFARSSRAASRTHRVLSRPANAATVGLGVVAALVEAPVPRRCTRRRTGVNSAARGQRRRGHRDRGNEPEHLGGEQHKPRVHPDEQAGHDRVGQRAGEVLSMSNSRYRKTATPMLTGTARKPIAPNAPSSATAGP